MCFFVALNHVIQICCKCMSCLYTNWNNRVMVVWVWCLRNTVQWLKEEYAAYIHILVLLGMRLINFIGIWMTAIGVLCWVKVRNFVLCNCCCTLCIFYMICIAFMGCTDVFKVVVIFLMLSLFWLTALLYISVCVCVCVCVYIYIYIYICNVEYICIYLFVF